MHHQAQFPGMFAPEQGALPIEPPVAATGKQIAFATSIAGKVGLAPPVALFRNRTALSAWIDTHKPKPPTGQFANYPSSKQVAFAERIARVKRSDVPHECFRNKTLMSRWIDGNKPR
ncbi:hypothetical protein [Pseudosulfitobacter sp. SM2401]|uniref:hypothetical protein n=1 Tax=Pseudosulfitobacter sp. SM2401 TaxID=3350098 RepID=UPI0036F27087